MKFCDNWLVFTKLMNFMQGLQFDRQCYSRCRETLFRLKLECFTMSIRDAQTNFRTLRTPYSSYSVLVKMAVPRAKIRTPGVRFSSYSVLPVLGAENNDRTPYSNSYFYSTVLPVLRTPRAPCWKLLPCPVLCLYSLTKALCTVISLPRHFVMKK